MPENPYVVVIDDDVFAAANTQAQELGLTIDELIEILLRARLAEIEIKKQYLGGGKRGDKFH
jgi:antitoxin component of RelBE/YafQ-DinJ toxin-antitoxin module